jgi:hypothetical protein
MYSELHSLKVITLTTVLIMEINGQAQLTRVWYGIEGLKENTGYDYK